MPVDNYQRSFTGWSEEAADEAAAVAAEADPTGIAQPRRRAAAGDHTTAKPSSIEGWRVYVVDAHSLIFQVFHALPDMTSPRGEHVNAVYGFVRDMLQLIEQKQPDVLICAFDPPGPTFRDEIYDQLQGRPRRDARGARRPDSQDRAGARRPGDPRDLADRLRGGRRAGHGRAALRRRRAPSASSSAATRIAGN